MNLFCVCVCVNVVKNIEHCMNQQTPHNKKSQ